jgi:hypothetical protein
MRKLFKSQQITKQDIFEGLAKQGFQPFENPGRES